MISNWDTPAGKAYREAVAENDKLRAAAPVGGEAREHPEARRRRLFDELAGTGAQAALPTWPLPTLAQVEFVHEREFGQGTGQERVIPATDLIAKIAFERSLLPPPDDRTAVGKRAAQMLDKFEAWLDEYTAKAPSDPDDGPHRDHGLTDDDYRGQMQ